MKSRLLASDDLHEPGGDPPAQWGEVSSDLEVGPLLDAMGAGDEYLRGACLRVLARACGEASARIIAYRQAALRDTLTNRSQVEALYAIVLEAIDARKKNFFFSLDSPGRHASWTLRSGIEITQLMLGYLQRLRDHAAGLRGAFASEAFQDLFEQLERELEDAWIAEAGTQLKLLGFRRGLLFGAALGPGNRPRGLVLYAGSGPRAGWWDRFLRKAPSEFTFRLHPRDEAGAAALSELHDRAINEVANALAQSADHVLGFFQELRADLAFYLGCANLHHRLSSLGVATCLPELAQVSGARMRARDLRDPSLALTLGRTPVGNDFDLPVRGVIVVTGANQGGKSTFLRSLGLAQCMLHAGMFVAASSFVGAPRTGIFTHYKREEDATMQGGKLDEELARMSASADQLRPGSVWLSNESFSSTNEREGSQILLDVVGALREREISVWMVTHLFDAARSLAAGGRDLTAFLRAPRATGGARGYRLEQGVELDTSYGADVYAQVFSEPGPRVGDT